MIPLSNKSNLFLRLRGWFKGDKGVENLRLYYNVNIYIYMCNHLKINFKMNESLLEKNKQSQKIIHKVSKLDTTMIEKYHSIFKGLQFFSFLKKKSI